MPLNGAGGNWVAIGTAENVPLPARTLISASSIPKTAVFVLAVITPNGRGLFTTGSCVALGVPSPVPKLAMVNPVVEFITWLGLPESGLGWAPFSATYGSVPKANTFTGKLMLLPLPSVPASCANCTVSNPVKPAALRVTGVVTLPSKNTTSADFIIP